MNANYYKPGSWNAICDSCGLQFKAEELRLRWDGLRVCDKDFELRNPQDFIKVPKEQITPPWTRPDSGTVTIQKTENADYTLVLADDGGQIYRDITDRTNRTWTIPANASVAFAVGAKIALVNNGADGIVTIAITSDTLNWNGNTGTRKISVQGFGIITKTSATAWTLTGQGIT